jgi:hypothetical protein
MSNKRGRYPLPHDFKLAGIMIVEKDFNYVISNYSDDEKFLNCLINGAFPWIGEEIGKQMGLNSRKSFSLELERYILYFEPYLGSYVRVACRSKSPESLELIVSSGLKMEINTVFKESESFKSEIYNDQSAEKIKTIFSESVPLAIK